ncbi:disulfide bond formation protein B [Massilia sp. TSP1-1-2]|uniref:disulfide bond formation protein B n=1 Tax=unclassified Massilia TaxID=2609279 RepID=UPI003CF96BBD
MPNNRQLLLTMALACFALIGGALYFQHVKLMLPCPLCVIQRYAFLFTGVFALTAAFTRNDKPWLVLSLASAIGGAYTVAKHLYVLANPGFSCGIDPTTTFLNKIPTATAMPWLFQADGLCEAAGDLIVGLSLPQWSAVAFALLVAGLLFTLVRRRA